MSALNSAVAHHQHSSNPTGARFLFVRCLKECDLRTPLISYRYCLEAKEQLPTVVLWCTGMRSDMQSTMIMKCCLWLARRPCFPDAQETTH
jgi:hypothetical protein